MLNTGWKHVKTEQILQHPRVPVFEDTVELPNGESSQYALLHLPDAVTVVIEQNGKFLLNFEYVYPVDDRVHRPDEVTSDGWLYKFPGGMLKQNEAYDAAARREVGEETGAEIDSIVLLAAVRNYFPRSNSLDYKVQAKVMGTAQVNRDAEEANMQQHWLTATEIDALIAAQDPRVLHSHFLDTWLLYKTAAQVA